MLIAETIMQLSSAGQSALETGIALTVFIAVAAVLGLSVFQWISYIRKRKD